MAEYIAASAQPRAVLAISNPFTQHKGRPAEVYAFEKAGIDGLKEGFGAKATLTVAFPKLKEEVLREPGSAQVDPKTTTPLSFLVADTAFSDVIQQNPNCEVVVSLIGLPVNLSGMKEWSQPGGRKFALLLPDWRIIGGREEIIRVFRAGKLIVAVADKPQASDTGASNYKERFAERFLLVTAENVEKLLAENPAIFRLP